jgi:hypothetical protein
MDPIRIGIFGLAYGAWAANAQLPYLQSPKFQIVAICNSYVESAAKSIKYLKLLGEVRHIGMCMISNRKLSTAFCLPLSKALTIKNSGSMQSCLD